MANKLALVTGASSGIGFWLAKDLARRGYDLIACSAGDRLANAVEELQASDRKVNTVSADLSTGDGVTGALETGSKSRPTSRRCMHQCGHRCRRPVRRYRSRYRAKDGRALIALALYIWRSWLSDICVL